MKCKPFDRQPFVSIDRDCTHQTAPKLDAVFVPTCRSESAFLRQVEHLAPLTEFICVLPSGRASESFRANKTLPPNVLVFSSEIITDVHKRFLQRRSSQNPSQAANANYDLPAKRNLALHLARLSGLHRICLLDDDIIITPDQIRTATAVLSEDAPMSGFYVFEFPDVSTIDHVHRMVSGTPSETLPGGNCLFMLVDFIEGFFPYIYNEDWIFVLHNSTRRTGFAMGEVKQEAHAPWRDHGRVKFEEFGEALISGLLPLGDVMNASEARSVNYWASVCLERRQWLSELQKACADAALRQTIQVAAESLELFDPRDFVHFVLAVKNELNDYLWLPNTLRLL